MSKKIITGETELVIKSPSNQKTLEPEHFTGKFIPTFKEQRNRQSFIIQEDSENRKKKKSKLPSSFYKVGEIKIPKLGKLV